MRVRPLLRRVQGRVWDLRISGDRRHAATSLEASRLGEVSGLRGDEVCQVSGAFQAASLSFRDRHDQRDGRTGSGI